MDRSKIPNLDAGFGNDFQNPLGWRKQFVENHDKLEGWMEAQCQAALYNMAKLCAPESHVVEIGAYKGLSTVHVAAGRKVVNAKNSIYVIDPFCDAEDKGGTGNKSYFKQDFINNVERCGLTYEVIIVEGLSNHLHGWIGTKCGGNIELLFIDGDHTYDGVKRDYNLYYPMVKVGGLIAFHDSGFEGIAKALAEIKAEGNCSLVQEICSMSIFYKDK